VIFENNKVQFLLIEGALICDIMFMRFGVYGNCKEWELHQYIYVVRYDFLITRLNNSQS
jgi:hypothetical protein